VVISGLDGDSSRNTFGQIISLIPICDKIDKLTAYCNICKDGTPAPFTKKCGGSSTEAGSVAGPTEPTAQSALAGTFATTS
jgi:thymidine kinase